MTNKTNSFKFYSNFLDAINVLPENERATACYEFCKYGITGQLPTDKNIAMFCVGVSVSVHKYQGSGGKRDGAGRKPKQNQNNQNNQNEQTKTKTETKNYKYCGKIIKLNDKDYFEWEKKYPDLDLPYCLERLDIWFQSKISERPELKARWFFMAQSMLLKDQKEAESRNNLMGRG